MTDADFMALALDEARLAAAAGEVPVGAVVVRQGRVIASGRNALLGGHDPTAHAEIMALRAAATALGNYRLGECELFVTLEPCAMCSGAILNARLKRVVFGAPEPRTGAAGSVINVFSQTGLNHQTGCQGGVLAEESRALMQDFFRQRRLEQRALAQQSHPLRDDALRTPDAAFDGLPAYPWKANYRSDLPALGGLRMHYLDEQGPLPDQQGQVSPVTYLCLHGFPGWSYEFHQVLPGLLGAGQRVVAPDLVGFGKSDKPKKAAFHTFQKHRQILLELVEALALQNIVLVLSPRHCLLGMTLPVAAPMRYRGFMLLNEEGSDTAGEQALDKGIFLWNQSMQRSHDRSLMPSRAFEKIAPFSPSDRGWSAPFPSESFQVGAKAFPAMAFAVAALCSVEIFQKTEQFWKCRGAK